MVLDGLRFNEHPTHLTIGEAVLITKELSPKIAYLTHMNHDVLHSEAEKRLPTNVRLAYDGLVVSI